MSPTSRSSDNHWWFPRNEAGSPPQLWLLALFADYWLGRREPLPSAALVDLLGDFGISESSARVALSRLTGRGFLMREYAGRNTFYNLSPKAIEFISNRTREILAPEEPPHWDGQWTCVAYSIPEEHSQVRPKLRLRLKVLGFASLFDGLWVSALPAPPSLGSMLTRLLPDKTFVVLRGQRLALVGDVDPATAFDLGSSRAAHEEFIDRYSEVRTHLVAGRASPAEALIHRTKILDSYRDLTREVRALPPQVLGPDWPGTATRELFVEVYNSLTPLALMHVKNVLGRYDRELAESVTAYTTETFTIPALATPD